MIRFLLFSFQKNLQRELRIAFNNPFLAEISDVDGILWGQHIYLSNRNQREDRRFDNGKLGPWFGLDLGPFVKLRSMSKAWDLHSLFVVHEIDSVEDRIMWNGGYITFEKMAQYASWNSSAGGQAMTGGTSTVVVYPMAEFSTLTKAELEKALI